MDAVAQRYVEEPAARPEVEAIILSGSRARGDNRPDTLVHDG